MGGIQKRLHLVEHPQGLDASQKRQRIAQDAGCTSTIQTRNIGMGERTYGYGSSRKPGFSGGSSSDRLTEEQENEIAENIYDWWISGKSYKQWYAEKFQQLKLKFDTD